MAAGSLRDGIEEIGWSGWVPARHHERVGGLEWEYQRLYLPRGVSRRAAQQLLTEYAEYGHWELDRLRLFPDGSRRVVLRRRIIRQRRTSSILPVPSG